MNEKIYPRDILNLDDVTDAHLLIEGVAGFTEQYQTMNEEELRSIYKMIYDDFSLSMSKEGQDKLQALSNLLMMNFNYSAKEMNELKGG